MPNVAEMLLRRSWRRMVGLLLVGLLSGCATDPRLVDANTQQLAPCPLPPHCVSSQSSDRGAAIRPLAVRTTPAADQATLRRLIAAMPRTAIVNDRPGYLYATFETPRAGFVDDVEFVLSPDQRVFHVRSSSRIGWFDWDVNRDRGERIRVAYLEATSRETLIYPHAPRSSPPRKYFQGP